MKFRSDFAALLLAFAAAALSACSAVQPTDAEKSARYRLYEDRASTLSKLESWTLEGRLAVSNEKDGGSGHFIWKKSEDFDQMDFHGALGRGAWRLQADADSAVLELSDGSLHRADTIEELVSRELGWEVPVQSLSWWVRGLAAPGDAGQSVLDEQGRLSELQQREWRVKFDRYREVRSMQLPIKMTARQLNKTVKLVIREWNFSRNIQSDE